MFMAGVRELSLNCSLMDTVCADNVIVRRENESLRHTFFSHLRLCNRLVIARSMCTNAGASDTYPGDVSGAAYLRDRVWITSDGDTHDWGR